MDELTLRLLWLGVEDESPLWEARGEWTVVNGGDDATAAKQVVGGILDGLARSGLVEFFRGTEPLDCSLRTRIEPGDVRSTIDEEPFWFVPTEDDIEVVKYRTTDEGFAAYKRAVGWRTE